MTRFRSFLPDGSWVNVYNFSEHLKNVGDSVDIGPADFKGRQNFKKQAHKWATRKGYMISSTTIWLREDGEYPAGKGIRITLIRKYRYRF